MSLVTRNFSRYCFNVVNSILLLYLDFMYENCCLTEKINFTSIIIGTYFHLGLAHFDGCALLVGTRISFKLILLLWKFSGKSLKVNIWFVKVIHKPRGHNFWVFVTPLPPSWPFLLNKSYVIKYGLLATSFTTFSRQVNDPLSSFVYVVYEWPIRKNVSPNF